MGTGVGDKMNVEKARYHRVIIMTDADVDGSHIRTLLLTLLFRYFPELIERGYIYIAQPPLFQIKKGKQVKYAYTDEEKEKIISKMTGGKKLSKEDQESGKTNGIILQRYKGLGEMNPDQLWETTMNPETRVMQQVTIEDAQKADKIFDILMGNEVAPRKKFIQAHARSVQNLDV
jgi:DNA gyrase subunit B